MIDLPDKTITEILNQISLRDDKASTRLYRHYFDFVYAFVRHRIADDAAADEIAHDVFLSVWKKPLDFSGRSQFSTWLCAIAKFKAVDWWRKHGKSLIQEESDEHVLEEAVDPNWDFVSRMEMEQDAEALRYCRDRLPIEQRDCVFWAYFEDKGLEQIAQLLVCPVGTVKSRLSSARKRLRDCMDRWDKGGRYA